MSGEETSATTEELTALAVALVANRERTIIEDQYGSKFFVRSARVVGAKTDDPGVLVRVEGS